MLDRKKIDLLWSMDPSAPIDDFCKGSGEQVTRAIVETFGQYSEDKIIQISSKRLSPEFYDRLHDLFKKHASSIELVVFADQQEWIDTKVAKLVGREGKLFHYEGENRIRESSTRFLNIPHRASRVCIATDPYRARSF